MRNVNKSAKISYSEMLRKWKIDSESTYRTRSPLKVNQFFARYIDPIITASLNKIG